MLHVTKFGEKWNYPIKNSKIFLISFFNYVSLIPGDQQKV